MTVAKMKGVVIFVMFAMALHSVSARTLAKDLRAALSRNPMLSHRRDVMIPQNVNVVQPIRDAPTISRHESASTQFGQDIFSQASDTIPKAAIKNQQDLGQSQPNVDRPGNQPSQNRQPQLTRQIERNPMLSHRRDVMIPQNVNVVKAVVKKPTFSRKRVVNQPSQIIQSQRPKQNMQPVQRTAGKPVINDRMADRVTTKANVQKTRRKRPAKCPFSFSSFLFSDTNITQIDFEQKYLIPALRAHLSGNCNSRAMTIHLDWLLHLRERMFNV